MGATNYFAYIMSKNFKKLKKVSNNFETFFNVPHVKKNATRTCFQIQKKKSFSKFPCFCFKNKI